MKQTFYSAVLLSLRHATRPFVFCACTLYSQLVEELLGGPIKRPCRNRGIYSIFPRDMSRASQHPVSKSTFEARAGADTDEEIPPAEAQLNPHLDMQVRIDRRPWHVLTMYLILVPCPTYAVTNFCELRSRLPAPFYACDTSAV